MSTAVTAPPRHAWIDASAGVAGDMLLGALVDAGANLARVAAAVDAVAPGTVALSSHEVQRAGQRATKVEVTPLVESPDHRHWSDIQELLAIADLPDRVRTRAHDTFAALATAEGRAHGIDPDQVHFHEVGAWDSIADVVGVCAALEDLGVASVSAGAVAVGTGAVHAAHGLIPVPVPAVAELALGWRVRSGGEGELATPTGMALVRALAERCEDLPELVPDAVGVGAGTRDIEGRPNVVRVVLGAREDAGAASAMVLLETNVDDLDPRLWPGVLATLMDAGAADAWLTPILMKKGRPAHTLSVLSVPPDTDALESLMFELVPTLGVRRIPVARTALERMVARVEVDGVPVRVKLGLRGDLVTSATPEFVDVATLARVRGTTQRSALGLAAQAASASGYVVGSPLP